MIDSELQILALYGLFVVLVTVAQVLAAMSQVGLPALASSREDVPELVGVAGRMNRALNNCIVALALFAPAAVIVEMVGAATDATLMAAQAFLAARVFYVAIYAADVAWLRTLFWSVGFLATAYLYVVGYIAAAPNV